MAKEITAAELDRGKRLRSPGLHKDGKTTGLYLKVTPRGTRSWVYRWRDRLTSKLRDHGLGPCPPIGLGEARDKAQAAHRVVINGGDPIKDKTAERIERQRQASIPTFDECAQEYVDAHAPGWSNPKHIAQWRNTLQRYASPVIGKLPVNEVEPDHVLAILKPIWNKKNETASRVRGRIESVLDWAASPSRKYRTGDNPARWRGLLDKELPKPTKVNGRKHHAAMPFTDLPAFVNDLKQRQGTAAACLQFTILTACRTAESIGATWEEFDLERGVWTVPADRMKAGKEWRVPLSAAAVELLKQQQGKDAVYVFPGAKAGKHLSNMAMLKLLKDTGQQCTVHGMRSSFRDWTAETTSYPNEVCEMALAHTIGDKTEEAYRRGDLFDKRRSLMDDWVEYLAK